MSRRRAPAALILASEAAILTVTCVFVLSSYASYRATTQPDDDASSSAAAARSWIQLSSTPSILRLLYGCLCGDLDGAGASTTFGAAAVAWAGLTMLCARFGAPADLHAGHAHLVAVDAAAGTLFLLAVLFDRPAGEQGLGLELGGAGEREKDGGRRWWAGAGWARVIRGVVACWNVLRFVYVEYRLVHAGWGVVADRSIVEGLFWGQTFGFAVDGLLALAVVVHAAYTLVNAIMDGSISLFDASGYVLLGDVTATFRYVLDLVCICVLAVGPLTGTTLHVSQYAALISMMLPAWCAIGTINMFLCSSAAADADGDLEGNTALDVAGKKQVGGGVILV